MRIKKNVVDVNFGRLFPWPFQLLGAIVLLVAMTMIRERPGVSIFLLLLGVFVLSASEGTEINKERKIFREYKTFFFLKSGSWLPYSEIEKIFVNVSRTKQQMHTAHTNTSSIFIDEEFNGFLKFDNGTKIQLLRKKKKASLLKSLRNTAAFLQVPLEDNTSS